jgi:hypothetical protein
MSKSKRFGLCLAALALLVPGAYALSGSRAQAEPAPPYSAQLDRLIGALERSNELQKDANEELRDLKRAAEHCGRD